MFCIISLRILSCFNKVFLQLNFLVSTRKNIFKVFSSKERWYQRDVGQCLIANVVVSYFFKMFSINFPAGPCNWQFPAKNQINCQYRFHKMSTWHVQFIVLFLLKESSQRKLQQYFCFLPQSCFYLMSQLTLTEQKC